ncbi:hypothetical protein [Microbulbifer variabilis]|uniref:hypothetical protein n=1 Tax=Microbulbifer variabilis TaxID=266805 RepID=UPI001CFE2E01|nr:hypothetical protein [Microbulbifer variabilis]
MNIETVVTIVETVSQVAVVITLFYLAIQIRQNTIQSRRSELDFAMEQSGLVRMALAENSELADIWLKGSANRRMLCKIEKLRFDSLVNQRFWVLFHMYDRTETGFLEESFWGYASKQLEQLVGAPGVQEWWQENLHLFPKQYIKVVARHVSIASS